MSVETDAVLRLEVGRGVLVDVRHVLEFEGHPVDHVLGAFVAVRVQNTLPASS